MKIHLKQYIVSLALLGSILFSQFATVLGQTTAFENRGNASYTLPSIAVVGSTAERRAAWDSLSSSQKASATASVTELASSARLQPRQPRTLDLTFVNDLGTVSENSSSASPEDSSAFFGRVVPRPTPYDISLDPDDDSDGLPDTFENSLANGFTPLYKVSGGENSGTGFSRFNNSVPQTVSQTFGATPPISHFRVKPLGFYTRANDPVQYGLIQLDYLTLWNRDDGLVAGSGCVVNPIINTAQLGSHPIDNERSALLVAAPVSNGGYNLNLQNYKLYELFTAGHESTFFDTSEYINLGVAEPLAVTSNWRFHAQSTPRTHTIRTICG